MRARKGISKILSVADLAKLELRIGLNNRPQGALTGTVYRIKINDTVFFFVLEVAQYSVDALHGQRGAALVCQKCSPLVAFCTKTHSSIEALINRDILSLALSSRSMDWYLMNLSGAASASF
jgi:hypothetical protein